jgi:receptor protein-tyrosine kinase
MKYRHETEMKYRHESSTGVSIRRLFATFRGNALLIVAVTLAAALAGLGLSRLVTPRYESQVQLFVQTATTPDSPGGLYSGGLYTQQRMASYAQLAKNKQLAQKVVDATKLPISAVELVNETTVLPASDTVMLTIIVDDRSPQMAQDLANGLAEQLTKQIAELETPPGSTVPSAQASIVQRALLPTVAVSPRTKRNVAFAGLLGLIVGCSLALLRAHFDTRLDDSSEVTEMTGTELIGVIPFEAKRTKQPLINFATGHSPMAEAFRQVRTNLLFADVDRPPHVITITGATSGEGRTTVAINLALALSETGSSVVFVEGDLRRPKANEYLSLVDTGGLTSVLSGTATIEQVIQTSDRHHVKVLGPGPLPPNPSELLGSQQMMSALSSLRKQFDYVVIDAPALLPFTDGAVLAAMSDGVIIVVRHRHTKIDQLRRAVGVLEGLDCNFLGAILNMVTTRSGRGKSGFDRAPATSTSATTPHIKPEPIATPRFSLRRGSHGNGNGHPAPTRHAAPSPRRPPNDEVRTDV